MFLTFLYFLKMEKVPKCLFWYFGHSLRTQYQSSESFFILFRIIKLLIVKNKPNGVSFKLFLDSLNMKRLSSTCLLHTHKSIWRVVSPTVGYLFFGSDRLLTKRNTTTNHDWKSSLGYYFILFQALETKSYKKGPFVVFFSLFRLYKHELHQVFFCWTR